jgi:hypothetical protein
VEEDKSMKHILALTAAAALGLMALAAPAHAQASRTWVSGVGDDANPCSRTAPCKTFAGAISKTAAGGQIDVLDPGGFGALTITKAITIQAAHGGGFGSVLVAGTNGFNVAAGANDVVIIRGLDIDGLRQTASPGINGINYSSGGSLHVIDCFIHGFSNAALNVTTSATSGLYVHNTYLINSGTGMITNLGGGTLVSLLDQVHADNNVSGGISFTGGTNLASLSNSTVFGNNGNGVTANANATVTMLNDQVVFNNGVGVNANGGAIRIGGSSVTGNVTGVTAAGVTSYKNNQINGNTTDNIPVTAVPGGPLN